MIGKKIKQINNLIITYYRPHDYMVCTFDGRILEDRMSLEEAEDFCRRTKDFLSKNIHRKNNS